MRCSVDTSISDFFELLEQRFRLRGPNTLRGAVRTFEDAMIEDVGSLIALPEWEKELCSLVEQSGAKPVLARRAVSFLQGQKHGILV